MNLNFMKEILDKILEKLKHFGLEVAAFFSSRIFIKNFVGILGLFIVLFFFTSRWLKCYTNNGEVLQMDNFEGMNLLDAYELADKKGFKIEVDSVPLQDVDPLTVFKQHPKPNAPVKENRTVYLTVVQISKDPKTPPTLRGNNEDFDTYRRSLIRIGLYAKDIQRKYSRLAPNTILEVLYNGDTITDELRDGKFGPIPEGSTLEFIISEKGEGAGNVAVPNLVCKTYGEAKLILESIHLTLSAMSDQTVKDKNSAFIWRQIPEKGTLDFGEPINLWLTQNIPDDCDELGNPLEAPKNEENEEF